MVLSGFTPISPSASLYVYFLVVHSSPYNDSHRTGILDILKLTQPNKANVAHALLGWNAVDFETEAAARGMCATALRSPTEWSVHPQAEALRGVPPVTLTKIGEAPRRQIAPGAARPLDGVRVLDLSRVLAGPIAGRTLSGIQVPLSRIMAKLLKWCVI